jgi:nitric oxide reductase large subunit
VQEILPFVYGGFGGVGVLLVYYGFRRATAKERAAPARRTGLWMMNGGMILIGATLALAIWLK